MPDRLPSHATSHGFFQPQLNSRTSSVPQAGGLSNTNLGKFRRYLHRLVFYPLSLVAFFWGFLALRVNPFALLYDFEFLALLKALYIVGWVIALT